MNVDIEGIKSLLKKQCVICDVSEKRMHGIRCKKCPFVFNTQDTNSKRARVGTGAKFYKYGVPKDTGKHQFYYFLYYPELNFEYPPVPEIDLYDNVNPGTWRWIIHHLNGNHFDDRIWNLLLVLNTEHGKLHADLNSERNIWWNIQETSF